MIRWNQAGEPAFIKKNDRCFPINPLKKIPSAVRDEDEQDNGYQGDNKTGKSQGSGLKKVTDVDQKKQGDKKQEKKINEEKNVERDGEHKIKIKYYFSVR